MATTTRWSLPYPALDGSDLPDVPQWMHDLALALDGVAMDDQGTLANRPVSTPGSPGKKGRYYMVRGDSTSANNGILYRDNGTGWDVVGPDPIFDTTANRPAATAVPAGSRFFSTDQIAEWVSDGAAWHRIGAQPGDIVLTIEATARTGYILCQGQSWPATTGIYADLHTLWGGTTLPDLRDRALVAAGVNLAVLANDGVSSANRHGLRHKHVLQANTAPDTTGSGATSWLARGQGTGNAGTYTVGDGNDPQDAGCYLALQPQAKL